MYHDTSQWTILNSKASLFLRNQKVYGNTLYIYMYEMVYYNKLFLIL